LRIVVLAAARVFAPAVLEAAGLDVSALRAIPDDATYGQICMAALSAERQAAGAPTSWSAGIAARSASMAAVRAAQAAGVLQAETAAAAVVVLQAAGVLQAETAAAAVVVLQAAGAAQSAAAAAVVAVSRGAGAWDAYFSVLDEALRAGPQGEPWSADVVESAVTAYRAAMGVAVDA
jgi:hypothetical protein